MNRKDSAVTRARILKTAEKLFSEKGFDGARVDEIARDAGVNKALIYYYFKSKDDILDALFTGAIKDIIELMEDTYEDFHLDDAEVERMFDTLVGLISRKKRNRPPMPRNLRNHPHVDVVRVGLDVPSDGIIVGVGNDQHVEEGSIVRFNRHGFRGERRAADKQQKRYRHPSERSRVQGCHWLTLSSSRKDGGDCGWARSR